MQCKIWSVECEDFASSLVEKNQTVVEGRTRSGQGVFELYRSFMFGKLPPPACPGLC